MARRKKRDAYYLDDLKKKADDAKLVGFELSKIAAETGPKLGKELVKMGRERLEETLAAARLAALSPKHNLELLEQLGKLKKSGIISQKEFEKKKKEILNRI
ncbi:MAG: SHOCT domain-containing protein [Nitrosopumilaceae archaeon]